MSNPIDVYYAAKRAYENGQTNDATHLLSEALGTSGTPVIENNIDRMMTEGAAAHEAVLELIGYRQYAGEGFLSE